MSDLNLDKNECTASFLASLLGISSARVYQLVQEGVMFRASRGRYKFRESVYGYVKLIKNELNEGSESPLQKQKLELAVDMARANLRAKDRENDRAEKKLTPADGITEQSERLFAAVFQILQQIVPRIKRRDGRIEPWALKIIDEEVRKCQNVAASMQITPEGEYQPELDFGSDDDLDDELA